MATRMDTGAAAPVPRDFRFNDIILGMSRYGLKDIPWRTAKDKLFTLNIDTTIREALQTLTTNNILSAPVFDEVGTFWGFCDMQQLVRYVARLCTHQTAPDSAPDSAPLLTKMMALDSTTIRDLISGSTGRPIHGEYAWPINETASLYQAFERMAREGQHRLAIQDFTGRVVGVMCQSQVIAYLADNIELLGDGRSVPVNAIRPYTFVSTINENSTALSAFRIMDGRMLSHNAVAVVDNNNELTDVMSTHDLRGILPGSEDFDHLWTTVRDFKAFTRSKYPHINVTPVTVRTTATLGDVILNMNKNKVHRVFVVNAAGAPIDVVTQTDVLRYMLNTVIPTVWW